jgi:hypothetical protein
MSIPTNHHSKFLACVIELWKVSDQIKSTTKTIGNQTNERFWISVPPNFSWPSNWWNYTLMLKQSSHKWRLSMFDI